MASFGFGISGVSGFEKTETSRPVPSTTPTRFPLSDLLIKTIGMNINPAISTGKKRVMKTNIFFRTAARYSRFRTARILFTRSPPTPRRRLSR